MTHIILENLLFLLVIPAILIASMRLFGILLQEALLNSSRFIWVLAPGTIIHELSHLLICLLFGLPINQVVLFHYEPETGNLGHVDYSFNPLSIKDRIGAALSGIAPIIGISALEYFIYDKLFPSNVNNLIADLKQTNIIEFIKDFFLPGGNASHLILFIIISVLLLSGYSISGADLSSVRIGIIPLIIIATLISSLSIFVPAFETTIILGIKLLFALSLAMIILCMLSLLIIKAIF